MLKESIIVETAEEVRIDKYLVTIYEELSRTELKKYFDEEKVLVNKKIVKPSFKVKIGDIIDLFEIVQNEIDIVKENIPLNILYEDSDIIVVNKPTGMVVHPAPGHLNGTLVNALMYHCNELSDMNGDIRAGIVHRIDKDTSGLLVACKNNYAHRIIADQLRDKTSTRKYFAIVHGTIDHNLGIINAPIGRDPNYRQKMAVVPDGKSAITHFKVLERFRNYTLVELQLETGRTHQIRVHMAYINHPVLGDPLYGNKKPNSIFGQYLHAKTLGFIHPRTNEYIEFTTDLPIEFIRKMDELRGE